MNIGLLLTMAAEGMPDRLAFGTNRDELTYTALLERASRTATWLGHRQVRNVACLDVNSDVVPSLMFGAAAAGLPFAPLNYRLADRQLGAILARLAPAVLIAEDGATDRVSTPGIEVVSHSTFLSEVATEPPCDQDSTNGDEVAIVMFTSGTTGEPKAAVLRHRHLVSYIISTVEFMSASAHEATLVCVPPYHIAGASAVLSSVYAGRRVVYLAAFDPREWIRLVREEQITHAMVVPTMLKRILDELPPDDDALKSLRHLAYGGGRMPRQVIEQSLDRMPEVSFVNAYGLTETSSTITLLGPEEHRRAHKAPEPVAARRLASVGQALPGVELTIRDDSGGHLARGEVGHIWVRGEQVSGEYAGSSDTSGDDWFNTKDVGWLDEEGFLFLEGRDDDVIVRGGENLSPGEIEDVIADHPKVADVAVVGLPSEEWGQVPVAVLVRRSGAELSVDEIQAWVRDRLRSSRTPESVVFVEALPYTDTGKLLRRTIREQLVGKPSGVVERSG